MLAVAASFFVQLDYGAIGAKSSCVELLVVEASQLSKCENIEEKNLSKKVGTFTLRAITQHLSNKHRLRLVCFGFSQFRLIIAPRTFAFKAWRVLTQLPHFHPLASCNLSKRDAIFVSRGSTSFSAIVTHLGCIVFQL